MASVAKKDSSAFVLRMKTPKRKLQDEIFEQYRQNVVTEEEQKKSERSNNSKHRQKYEDLLSDMREVDLFSFDKRISQLKIKGKSKDKELDRESYKFYEKRFSTELKAMYKMVQESARIEADLMALADSLKKSKNIRLYTDVMKNIIEIRKQRMDAFKENSSIKRIISDLEQKQKKMKQDTGGGSNSDGGSDDEMMIRLLGQMQSMTMNTKVSDFSEDHSDSSVDDDLEDRIMELEKNGELQFTDHENNLKFNDIEVKEIIVKNDETDEWKVVAIDVINDTVLRDYITTPKDSMGMASQIKFKPEEGLFEDSIGRSYDLLVVDPEVYESY